MQQPRADRHQELESLAGVPTECDSPLAAATSLKVGGSADYRGRARSAAELVRCLDAATRLRLPWTVLGGGSNVLVSDRGIRGLVVLNQARAVHADIRSDRVLIRCESGLPLARLSRTSAARGWLGLEFACGIPGTVGGAIAGNAGAYGGCMADVLEEAQVWTSEGLTTWSRNDFAFDYRSSRLKCQGSAVVVAATLQLCTGDPHLARAQIAANEHRRRATQPAERSVGSVFKNPPGDYAGRLIEAAGLKGTRRGGAEISRRHSNFFVNRGGAAAADMVALIQYAREVVEARYKVSLRLEIQPVGEWSPGELWSLGVAGLGQGKGQEQR